MRSSSQTGLKPQDILLLLKMLANRNSNIRQIDLAVALGISQSEVVYALNRLLRAGLLDESKKHVHKLAAIELVSHAIKYFYPPNFGSYVRGTPTGHSAKPLKGKFIVEEDMEWVWPDADGELRGLALDPIYETAPMAAKCDSELYELLVLLDAIRAGGVRERKIAIEEFKKSILQKK